MIISKMGFIFVEAEIMRAGNEQFLNNLEEGIVILDEDEGEVLFQNETAQCVSNKSSQSMNINIYDGEDNYIRFDMKNKMYAQVDTDIF